MSYKIEYSPHKNKRYPVSRKAISPALFIGIACFILAFVVFAADIPAYMDDWFLTLDKLAVQISTGTKVGQAVAAYCREMVSNVTAW